MALIIIPNLLLLVRKRGDQHRAAALENPISNLSPPPIIKPEVLYERKLTTNK
jgi:hypothetical protein